ncbi:hypothetical protein QN277_022300 [Acacia crassicarpa]|uniref:Uncharacterized protein n=1 Tax=Acacia crassicarpa TaxID=499986 RepID=A0AAE1JEN5_9FABA|nr:hypothetical protein QN277_022300 [Acacia crassicarpa]
MVFGLGIPVDGLFAFFQTLPSLFNAWVPSFMYNALEGCCTESSSLTHWFHQVFLGFILLLARPLQSQSHRWSLVLYLPHSSLLITPADLSCYIFFCFAFQFRSAVPGSPATNAVDSIRRYVTPFQFTSFMPSPH